MTRNIVLLFMLYLIFSFILLPSCSDDTPEKQLHLFFKQAAETVRDKNTKGLRKFISPSYRDSKNRTKDDLIRTSMGYFLRNDSIYLAYRIDAEPFTGDEKQIGVIVVTAISRSEIRSDFDLNNAEIYKLKLQLQYEGKWLLTDLEWQKAGLNDYLDLEPGPDS